MKKAFLDIDLVCRNIKCLDDLEVMYEYDVYKNKPERCPNCLSKELDGLEILGAKAGALFWECEDCMFKFLKYPVKNTLFYLKEASKYWYNPKDWSTYEEERN